MDGRRKPKWDNNWKKSPTKKPPRGRGGNWQPTVPTWEKRFCKSVGMDWEFLLQTQKFTYLYENVVNWDDSAGEEAFNNAKMRFWAEMNGLSCDVSSPDPDLYIDEVDWDKGINPELEADLESETVMCNTDKDHEPVIIFGDSLVANQGFSATGWGDNDDNFKIDNSPPPDPWEVDWTPSANNGGWTTDYYSNNAGYMAWGSGWDNGWGQSYVNNSNGFSGADGGWNDGWGQNYVSNNNNLIFYGSGSYGVDNQAHGGWNDGWGQSYTSNNYNYGVGTYAAEDKLADGGLQSWNDGNAVSDDAGRYNTRYNKQMPIVGAANR